MKKYLIIIPILLVFYFVTLYYKDIRLEDSKDKLAVNDNTIKDSNKEDESIQKDVIEENVKENNNDIKEKTVTVSYNGEEQSMSVDEYVLGVVACEVPASFNVEALKAMSVVARTFYLYKDSKVTGYVANNIDQCFINETNMREKWGNNYEKYFQIIKDAVDETAGEFVTYNNEVAQTFYFSMSNGKTENLENVFSEKRPYLVSVDSSWDKDVSSFEQTTSFTLVEFLTKLDLEVSDNVIVDVLSKTPSGRVEKIKINDVLFTGTDVRKKLGLRSTDFDIYLSNDISITTRGYGHGVGMSQYGANEMAKKGFSYLDIIKYYYKGVDISKL